MSILPVWLVATALAAPSLEVSTLDGAEHTGSLQTLNAKELVLTKDGKSTAVPLANLLDVRFPRESAEPAARDAYEVTLTDGTRLSCTKVAATGAKFTFESRFGAGELPLNSVQSVRLSAFDGQVEEVWQELQQRQIKRDMLIVRKGADVLDHLDGALGDVTEDGQDGIVNFLLGENQIPVKRSKVFGIIYARDAVAPAKSVCRVVLAGSDRLPVKSLSWDGKHLSAQMLSGTALTLPVEQIVNLDFSLGRLKYLSQMKPREIKYTPYYDITWEYRRDRNLDGEPIQIGSKQYTRGLVIHSKTLLRYRLGGDYRTFKAVMGVEHGASGAGADMHVVIRGDDRILFEGDVRDPRNREEARKEPAELNLAIEGVRDLEILVDFGGNLDFADHLALGDARVLK